MRQSGQLTSAPICVSGSGRSPLPENWSTCSAASAGFNPEFPDRRELLHVVHGLRRREFVALALSVERHRHDDLAATMHMNWHRLPILVLGQLVAVRDWLVSALDEREKLAFDLFRAELGRRFEQVLDRVVDAELDDLNFGDALPLKQNLDCVHRLSPTGLSGIPAGPSDRVWPLNSVVDARTKIRKCACQLSAAGAGTAEQMKYCGQRGQVQSSGLAGKTPLRIPLIALSYLASRVSIFL